MPILWYSVCSGIGFLVPNQKFIEFVTWQKKNLLNQPKNDTAIDFFVKSVITVDCPRADFCAEWHPLFHGKERFDDGFDRNFLGLKLNLPP